MPTKRFVIAALLLVSTTQLAGCHGHLIRRDFVPNHDGDFDLRRPPCAAARRPAGDGGGVAVRYLGVAGLYIEWRGVSVLTAPLFTRYGPLRVAFGSPSPDERAIRRGLEGLRLETVRAVLVGHSHYDHFADVPPILRDHATGAELYVNRSGARMLAAFPELAARTTVLEEREPGWIELEDDDGRPCIRILPVKSEHAPHLRGIHFAEGEIKKAWSSWSGRKLRKMKEGLTYAYVIDLLDDDARTVAFRIHYQDASGIPSRFLDDRPADVAVLCMPSHRFVDGYPEKVLRETRATHALLIHYEDFLRAPGKPLRMVPTLTDRSANRFMELVDQEMRRQAHLAGGPDPCGCGPCGPSWSMPLPGEWLRFRPNPTPPG